MGSERTAGGSVRTSQEQASGSGILGGGVGVLGWVGECTARALELLGPDRIAEIYWTKLADGAFSRSGAASQIAGGRYQIGAGGTGEIDLGITVGGNGQQLLTAVNVEDWYLAGFYNFPAAAFTAGAFNVPLGLFVDGQYEIYLLGQRTANVPINGAPGSATQFYLWMHNGIGQSFTSMGTVGRLGAATCPVGPDAVTFVEFVRKDAALRVYFNRVLAATLTGTPALDDMPGGPGYCFAFGNDATMAFRIGGLYLARGPI